MNQPLMPKATAVWLIDNTTLTFKQIADFCGLHELEVKGIADDLPTAEELSAFLATKRAKQNQNTKIGIGMAEPQEPVASIEPQEPVVGKAKK